MILQMLTQDLEGKIENFIRTMIIQVIVTHQKKEDDEDDDKDDTRGSTVDDILDLEALQLINTRYQNTVYFKLLCFLGLVS